MWAAYCMSHRYKHLNALKHRHTSTNKNTHIQIALHHLSVIELFNLNSQEIYHFSRTVKVHPASGSPSHSLDFLHILYLRIFSIESVESIVYDRRKVYDFSRVKEHQASGASPHSLAFLSLRIFSPPTSASSPWLTWGRKRC